MNKTKPSNILKFSKYDKFIILKQISKKSIKNHFFLKDLNKKKIFFEKL